MLLEGAILADARVIQRLSHLLRTRCPNRTSVAMKLEAAGVERNSAMIQHSPHRRLRCSDQLFVGHVQHESRKHPIPMVHEFEILSIIPPQGLKVVAEPLTRREVLL